MKSNRVNFTKSVISTLERRVNGNCSNPECGVPTSGPNLGKDTANCIGEAAHIAAASPGGPRYSLDQSYEDRKSINNGIWLCVNCATRIDKDVHRFTIEILKQWKRKAEEKALEEMGKIPISRKSYDALKAVTLGEFSRSNVFDAVRQICKLSVNELERIDPRFLVDIEYKDKQATYILLPKENIDCTLSVEGRAAEDFQEKYSAMLDHGFPIEMDMQHVVLTGTPLFDLHNGSEGKIVFSPTNIPAAICKVSIEGEKHVALDDVVGILSGGKKSIRFNGHTFGKYLSLELNLNFSEKGGISSFTMTHNFSRWNGISVDRLPYFSRIYNFYENSGPENCMRISLEIDGREVMSGKGKNLIKEQSVRKVFSTLRYISNVQKIAKFVGLNIVFKDEIQLNADEVRAVEDFCGLISNLPSYKGKEIGNINFKMDQVNFEADAMASLISGKSGPLHMIRENPLPLNLCGTLQKIPNLVISYSAVMLSKFSKCVDGYFDFHLVPDDECVCSVHLLHGAVDV